MNTKYTTHQPVGPTKDLVHETTAPRISLSARPLWSLILLGICCGVAACSPSAPRPPGEEPPGLDATVPPSTGPSEDVELISMGPSAFIMGTDRFQEPGPPTPVRVLPYRLARTETTVAQYRRCVEAGACAAPPLAVRQWGLIIPEEHGGPLPDPYPCNYHVAGKDHHPVNCVSWHEARQFAAWVSPCGRLPSEAEWEFAARANNGTDPYPWGTAPASCTHAVFLANHERLYCPPIGKGTKPVCTVRDGISPAGHCDLLGNVAEWVEDVFVAWYDCSHASEDYREGAGCDESDKHPGTSEPWISGVGPKFAPDRPDQVRPVRGEHWLSQAVSVLSGDFPVTGLSRVFEREVERRAVIGFRVAAEPLDDPRCAGEDLSR